MKTRAALRIQNKLCDERDAIQQDLQELYASTECSSEGASDCEKPAEVEESEGVVGIVQLLVARDTADHEQSIRAVEDQFYYLQGIVLNYCCAHYFTI